jgi:hypothetical protein
MGPLNCFPPKFLLNVPASRDHVQYVDKPMDLLGLRDVLRGIASFTEKNVFLRILSALVSVG